MYYLWVFEPLLRYRYEPTTMTEGATRARLLRSLQEFRWIRGKSSQHRRPSRLRAAGLAWAHRGHVGASGDSWLNAFMVTFTGQFKQFTYR